MEADTCFLSPIASSATHHHAPPTITRHPPSPITQLLITHQEECKSVRFFFSVWDNITEWDIRGFNKYCFESVGGVPTPFSKMILTIHMCRNWHFYALKVVWPLETVCALLALCL